MAASHKTLELTLASAKDLKKVNLFSKHEVYAVAGLSCDRRGLQRTLPDREGRRNPSWNVTLRFPIPATADPRSTTLDVLLRAERSLGDRDIGVVRVPLSELENGSVTDKRLVSYQVLRPCGRAKGVLNFSYRFADPIHEPIPDPTPEPIPRPKVDEEPVMAYPVYPQPYTDPPVPSYPAYPQPCTAPPSPSYPAYPQPYTAPPSPSYPAYNYPTTGAGGYGYRYGDGSVHPKKPPPSRNKLGMGAGLLGGAIGGLVIGDMLSDAAFDF